MDVRAKSTHFPELRDQDKNKVTFQTPNLLTISEIIFHLTQSPQSLFKHKS